VCAHPVRGQLPRVAGLATPNPHPSIAQPPSTTAPTPAPTPQLRRGDGKNKGSPRSRQHFGALIPQHPPATCNIRRTHGERRQMARRHRVLPFRGKVRAQRSLLFLFAFYSLFTRLLLAFYSPFTRFLLAFYSQHVSSRAPRWRW
jgi:hypothetical protein